MVGVEGEVLRAEGVEGVRGGDVVEGVGGGGCVEGVGGGSCVEGVGGGVRTPVIYPLMLLLFCTWVFCLHCSSPDKDKVMKFVRVFCLRREKRSGQQV